MSNTNTEHVPDEQGYYYEPPSAWQARFEHIQKSSKLADLAPEELEGVTLSHLRSSLLGALSFTKGKLQKANNPRAACGLFIDAFNNHYVPAVFEIDHIFRTVSRTELGMSTEDFVKAAASWAEIADQFARSELEDGLLTGTRPVMWQQHAGTPDALNPHMGGGSFFMTQVGDHQFAVTALHVVTNVSANPDHFRLLLPDTKQILPVFKACAFDSESPHFGEHQGDIIAWQINIETFKETAEWWTWRMDTFVKPATALMPGQRLFAVGFPEFEENIDLENFDLAEYPFIATGRLSDPFVPGLFTMEFDAHLPEVDLNGMSGGPVFARFDELFHYVGLMIRGNGKLMNFISSEHVLDLFDQILARNNIVQTEQGST